MVCACIDIEKNIATTHMANESVRLLTDFNVLLSLALIVFLMMIIIFFFVVFGGLCYVIRKYRFFFIYGQMSILLPRFFLVY